MYPDEQNVYKIGGTYVNNVYTAPASATVQFPTLSKRQIGAALISAGLTLDPDAWMNTILSSITDDLTRALALNDWRTAPYYTRDNALFNNPQLLAAAGLTTQTVNKLWAYAVTLPE